MRKKLAYSTIEHTATSAQQRWRTGPSPQFEDGPHWRTWVLIVADYFSPIYKYPPSPDRASCQSGCGELTILRQTRGTGGEGVGLGTGRPMGVREHDWATVRDKHGVENISTGPLNRCLSQDQGGILKQWQRMISTMNFKTAFIHKDESKRDTKCSIEL